jgi:hypothetical protein
MPLARSMMAVKPYAVEQSRQTAQNDHRAAATEEPDQGSNNTIYHFTPVTLAHFLRRVFTLKEVKPGQGNVHAAPVASELKLGRLDNGGNLPCCTSTMA